MSFVVTIELPAELEDKLRRETSNLEKDVREAYALQLFREGKLSHFELSQMLGLDRFETDAYLQRHRVYEGSLTMEDLASDRSTLEDLLKKSKR